MHNTASLLSQAQIIITADNKPKQKQDTKHSQNTRQHHPYSAAETSASL